LNSQGYRFFIITDQELHQPVLQSNLKILRNYLRVECDSNLIRKSQNWLKHQHQPTLKDLISYLDSSKKAYALLARRHIAINFFEDIQSESILILLEENSHETSFFSCRFAPDFK
jgi:hypothetical protein